MGIEAKTDYVEEATETLLPSHPFGATGERLKAVLAAFVAQIQAIEDDAIAIAAQRDYRDLELIEGVHLDTLGKRIGQPRWGRADADYRVLLACRIIANNSRGTPEPLLEVFALLTGGSTIEYTQQGSACFRLRWTVVTASDAPTERAMAAFVEAMAPSGVEYALIEIVSSLSPVFAFDTVGAGFDQGHFAARRIA